MLIKVHNPAITVTLFKMIKRVTGLAQRYASVRSTIDLTLYRGESDAVCKSKFTEVEQ